MDASLYPRMAEVEDEHWWFAGRRAIVGHLLDRLGLPPDAAILEPGCGTGGNFPMLARYGRLYAMDADSSALAFAGHRGNVQLAEGRLPDAIPFARQFDLVVMTDVLEHLDQDAAALAALRTRLVPGGWLLLTVPALPALWSEHDLTHHHKRRYRAAALRTVVAQAGFAVHYLSYYNFILFPLIAGTRTLQRFRSSSDGGGARHDLKMPGPAVNRLLRRVFASERHLIGRVRVPFGVSLVMLARAPRAGV